MKAIANSATTPVAALNISDDTWNLMAELEGIGHALGEYVKLVQSENFYTGGYRLIIYFAIRALLDREGDGVLQFVRPVTCDPPPRRVPVAFDDLSSHGQCAWQRAEEELEIRLKKSEIGNGEVIAMLGDIRLAKQSVRLLADGVRLKLVPDSTIANVTVDFQRYHAAVKNFKRSISPQDPASSSSSSSSSQGRIFLFPSSTFM
jgi:hypothetical protein